MGHLSVVSCHNLLDYAKPFRESNVNRSKAHPTVASSLTGATVSRVEPHWTASAPLLRPDSGQVRLSDG